VQREAWKVGGAGKAKQRVGEGQGRRMEGETERESSAHVTWEVASDSSEMQLMLDDHATQGAQRARMFQQRRCRCAARCSLAMRAQ
jgi:hypothetical protein